ncbi:MAG TPA: M64 family metallopeptidase [Pyrinomonadaceae bacterium]|jgi:hypothetical protein|nr:M64 family metallopeptidase [Pyrinomonadaceae bacterium]
MKIKSSRLMLAAFFLCVVFGNVSVQAEPYEVVLNNGNSQNRVDLVILGDGYTAAEQQKYRNDVQTLIQGFFSVEPFLEYQKYFNVYRVDVLSAQSGADHPERSSFVDTAFDGGYNCAGIQRLICVNTSKVNDVLVNTLGPTQRDMVVVVVNDPEYGGSGGGIGVVSTNVATIELMLHEEGHSFGRLADEYGGPPPPSCNNSFEPFEANVTHETQRSLIKWNSWIDPATPIPTASGNPGVPGLYQGAAYCDAGLYRPTFSSKMRTLGAPYEQINVEELVKRTYNYVSPIDSRLPSSDSISLLRGQTQSFSASTPALLTHNLTVSWTLDGQLQALGLSFSLDSSSLSPGNHTVSLSVSDPTPLVRNDPNHLLSAVATWNVNVVAASPVQFDASNYNKGEGDVQVNITVTRTGDLSSAVMVDYATSDTGGANGCNIINGAASSRCDYLSTLGTLHFAANESSKTISIPIVDDSYAEGSETFTITLSNPTATLLGSPSVAAITITDNDTVNGPNPADQASSFVRQHYIDFLNREPDPGGLAFWSDQITSCGADQACVEVRRINVSAAFFLSIEFQETGYLVYRMYQTAYGTLPGSPVPLTFSEFLPDTQQIGQGVQVGIGNWQAQLESNKQIFTAEFVKRVRFTQNFATSLTPAQFVDTLFTNAGVTPSAIDRNAAVNEFDGAGNTTDVAARARALRRVAENSILKQQETNRAFVLMQYFGYLRRNPFDPPEATLDFTGYNFWLGKLNQFNGNFVNAEMVKAFIVAGEYRHRFGP